MDQQTLEELLTTQADALVDYIVEVDQDYPSELHERHSDYPLAPETMEVKEEWLSEYQKQIVSELGDGFAKCKKLVPHFRPRERYVMHYRNLQQCVALGMHVTKLHRVLKFRQVAWMEPYIRLNTELRTKATTEFEKDFFKLMINEFRQNHEERGFM